MLWVVNAQLSSVERGKPNERSTCRITAQGCEDLFFPFRLFPIKALITKAYFPSLALLCDRWETGLILFCFYYEGGLTP